MGLVDVRRAALLLLLATCAIACAPPAASPRDIVLAYFRDLARDPIRTLALVTPEFHRRHGLRVATAAEARAAAARRAPDANVAALATDRHQLGWLVVQSPPELARLLADATTTAGPAREDGDAASIAVAVLPREGPAFEQRFALVRDGEATWRIDAIEQSGVVPANAAVAFAAYPNETARRALADRRGR